VYKRQYLDIWVMCNKIIKNNNIVIYLYFIGFFIRISYSAVYRISACLYVTAHDTDFDIYFSIHIFDTLVFAYACHLAFILSLIGSFLTPLGLHV